MRYYCNICRETITQGEFNYSMDKFGRALCRVHQEMENAILKDNNESSIESPIPPKKEYKIEEQTQEPKKQEKEEEIIMEKSSPGWKRTLKGIAIKTGKGIAKGAKAVAEATREHLEQAAIEREKRRIRMYFKEKILRRMNQAKLKQICREKSIATSVAKSKLVQSRSGRFYTKRYTHRYTFDELVRIVKRKITLDEIIRYAKRNKVNIRDILTEIEQLKAEEEAQQMIEQGENLNEFYWQVANTIKEFKPFRRYSEELPYQIDLARWLQGRFPRTKIEETRGSARPDIVIRGVAIEVKGPTSERDLQTVSDKCMRYSQYFKQGLIIVLFDCYVNQYRYNDWLKGMKNTFPDVMVIKKQTS